MYSRIVRVENRNSSRRLRFEKLRFFLRDVVQCREGLRMRSGDCKHDRDVGAQQANLAGEIGADEFGHGFVGQYEIELLRRFYET